MDFEWKKKVFYSESMDPPCESKSGLRSYFQSLIKSKQLDYILLLTKKQQLTTGRNKRKKVFQASSLDGSVKEYPNKFVTPILKG